MSIDYYQKNNCSFDKVAEIFKVNEKNNSAMDWKRWIKYTRKIKHKYRDFDITETHLSRVIRDNNFTRKRTKIRDYPETRYNKPIDFVKEMKKFL